MACLHLISAFLFSGGRGTWYEFLDTAGDWVEATICDYGESPHLALLGLSERGRFIFRATMWMDVFSGVSLCRPPRFLRWYQQLFRPGVSLPDDLGMERIMGCPNDVILAFAETAWLEHDKECQTAATTTSNGGVCSRSPEADMMLQYMLRERGMQIEMYIPEVAGPVPLPSWERFVELKDVEDGTTDTETAERETRMKVAEVFKQAARVYLHSVIEGCDPQVPTIRRAVLASIQALTVRARSTRFRSIFFLTFSLFARHYVRPHSTAPSCSPSRSLGAWLQHRPRSTSASPVLRTSATTPTRLAIACRPASSSTQSGRSAPPWASTETVYPSNHNPSTGVPSCASWVKTRFCWSNQPTNPINVILL